MQCFKTSSLGWFSILKNSKCDIYAICLKLTRYFASQNQYLSFLQHLRFWKFFQSRRNLFHNRLFFNCLFHLHNFLLYNKFFRLAGKLDIDCHWRTDASNLHQTHTFSFYFYECHKIVLLLPLSLLLTAIATLVPGRLSLSTDSDNAPWTMLGIFITGFIRKNYYCKSVSFYSSI